MGLKYPGVTTLVLTRRGRRPRVPRRGWRRRWPWAQDSGGKVSGRSGNPDEGRSASHGTMPRKAPASCRGWDDPIKVRRSTRSTRRTSKKASMVETSGGTRVFG